MLTKIVCGRDKSHPYKSRFVGAPYMASVMLIVFLMLIVAPAAAQDVDTLAAQMESALDEALATSPTVPGFAVAVIKDGEVIWSDGYGVADVEAGTPVTADTIFPAASISKVVTAYEILSLVDEGLIDLDTPVNSYLTRWQVPALGRNDPDEGVVILSNTPAGDSLIDPTLCAYQTWSEVEAPEFCD